VKGILQAVSALDKERGKHSRETLSELKHNVLPIAKKVILEILSKCFHN
jgi:hypothetical protein